MLNVIDHRIADPLYPRFITQVEDVEDIKSKILRKRTFIEIEREHDVIYIPYMAQKVITCGSLIPDFIIDEELHSIARLECRILSRMFTNKMLEDNDQLYYIYFK